MIYTPKSAQNLLNLMIQLKYDHNHDPIKLTYGFAVALCYISKHMFYGISKFLLNVNPLEK
jgi:hypothetical protein